MLMKGLLRETGTGAEYFTTSKGPSGALNLTSFIASAYFSQSPIELF